MVGHDDQSAGAGVERRFGSLDGVRAVSIVLVLWHHAGGESMGVPFQRGFLGVDLFFEISGFLIVTLLLRERASTGTISLRAFYARRALRIFPLYYAVMAVAFVASRVGSSGHSEDLREELPYAVVYMSNWVDMDSLLSITWSLSAEEQFYLVWPLTMVVAGRRSFAVAGIAIAVFVGLQLAHSVTSLSLPGFLWQASYTPILFGVALAHLLHEPRSRAVAERWFGSARAAPITLVVLVAAASWPGEFDGVPRLVVHLAMLAFLTSCVVTEDHALAPVLRFGPVARIGVISYGIYLLHMLARHVGVRLIRPLDLTGEWSHTVALFAVMAVLSVAMAEVSYRVIETPFLRLKQRFASASRRGG